MSSPAFFSHQQLLLKKERKINFCLITFNINLPSSVYCNVYLFNKCLLSLYYIRHFVRNGQAIVNKTDGAVISHSWPFKGEGRSTVNK